MAFVTQQIEQTTVNTLDKIYYNEASINEILPDDVLQHALSFDDLYQSKTVCKKWKSLLDKSEDNIMYQPFIDESSTNQSGSTWIIHPKRPSLNRIERELVFKGPKHMIDAMHNCVDGDRLLIHDGFYSLSRTAINKSIQLIGIGKNIQFDRSMFISGNNRNIRLQNISFHGYGREVGVIVHGGRGRNNVSIKNCAYIIAN